MSHVHNIKEIAEALLSDDEVEQLIIELGGTFYD